MSTITDLSLVEAQKQPRFHHQLLPENTIFFEPYAPASASLQDGAGGAGLQVRDQDFNGDIEAIQVRGRDAGSSGRSPCAGRGDGGEVGKIDAPPLGEVSRSD
jgi:gamma-glutamyltranspeptidase